MKVHCGKRPRDRPAVENDFYSIQPNDNGTVDVLLRPVIHPMIADGVTDYDISVICVPGVVPWDGLEDDIRARFDDWCKSGETIFL